MYRPKFHEFFRRSRATRRKSKLKQPGRGIETLESRCMLSASSPYTGSLTSSLKKLGVDTNQEFDSRTILVTLSTTSPKSGSLAATTMKEGKVRFSDGDLMGTADKLMTGIYEIRRANGVNLAQIIRAYQKAPHVKSAGANYFPQTQQIPNDSGFGQMWGLNNTADHEGGTPDVDINAPEAWDITTGSGSFVIGVIDSGVDFNHPDLRNNIWVNPGEIPGNGIDDDGNGYIDDVYGWDFIDDDNNPMDEDGHGTHVAGTIAAEGNNNLGTSGVIWNAKIMPLRAIGGAPMSVQIEAIAYSVSMGVKLTSNSWGFDPFPGRFLDQFEPLREAIRQAGNAGQIFVAAAGNDGLDIEGPGAVGYPSTFGLSNIVSVAAIDRFGELADFSNYGIRSVDLAAPGVDVYSTFPGMTFGSISGTSMATPHVAGAIALLWDKFPSLSYKRVINLILDNVTPMTSLRNSTVTGGMLDIEAALRAAGGKPSTDDGVPGTGNQPPNNAGEKLVQASNLKDVALADVGASRSTINIDSNFSITDLDVWVDISHTYDSQLRMTLYAPNNSVAAVLVHRQGGGGDHFSVTTFDDSALKSINDGKAPFAGRFRPRDTLSVFNGINAKGTWKLLINDYDRGRAGILKGWGLVIRGTTGTPASAATTSGTLSAVSGSIIATMATFQPGYVINVGSSLLDPQPEPFTSPFSPSPVDYLTAEAIRVRDELYANGVSTTEQDEAVDLLAPLSLDEVAA